MEADEEMAYSVKVQLQARYGMTRLVVNELKCNVCVGKLFGYPDISCGCAGSGGDDGFAWLQSLETELEG